MADLTVVRTLETGVEATLAAASAGGDLCANTRRTLLKIVNGGGASITVTVSAQQVSCGEIAAHHKTIVVAAGKTIYAGPFDRAIYNNADGKLVITYSGVTSLTIGGLEVLSL